MSVSCVHFMDATIYNALVLTVVYVTPQAICQNLVHSIYVYITGSTYIQGVYAAEVEVLFHEGT